MYTWSFAIKRAILVATTDPVFGTENRFTLPAGWMKIVELYGSTTPWWLEGGYLLTADTSASVRYVYQETDTTLYDPLFIQALITYLAEKMAYPLTRSQDVVKTCATLFAEALGNAKLIHSRESVPVSALLNQALALLGINSVANLDENQIRILESIYLPTLKETLADHEWNFAISRATLAEALPAPDFGYAHKFTLPADCIRVVELYDSDSTWRVEGAYLMTDDDDVKIVYIAYISDTTKFSPLFTAALVYHLASKCAVPMTKDISLQKQNYQLYRNTIDNARSVDSREGTPDDITSSVLIDVRS
jgi:hypothetical protein